MNAAGHKKTPSNARGVKQGVCRRVLGFGQGLFETDDTVPLFPLATLFKQIDALESFENGAILFAATSGGIKAVVLSHGKSG